MAKITIGESNIPEQKSTLIKVDIITSPKGGITLYFCDTDNGGCLVVAELSLFEAKKLIKALNDSANRIFNGGKI